jgi:hypothetical protein
LPVSAWTISLFGLSGTGTGTLTPPLNADSQDIPYRATEARLEIAGERGYSGAAKFGRGQFSLRGFA